MKTKLSLKRAVERRNAMKAAMRAEIEKIRKEKEKPKA